MAVVGAWAFVAVERRNPAPLVPASIFRSRQFSGANGLTLFVYFGISGLFFFTAVGFQEILGWSAATAGAALLPSSVVMILLSPAAGRFSARHGPRLGVAGGAASIAVGTAMLATVGPGDTWARSVLPASIVIGLGMAAMVPTLTAAVLAAVPDDDVGVGAAVNNTVARSAGLLALASVPGLVGDDVAAGYDLALVICACAIAVGAVVGALTVGRCVATHTSQAPNPLGGCAQLSHPAQPVR
jgi:predicted MFS family arabinose efflux permease